MSDASLGSVMGACFGSALAKALQAVTGTVFEAGIAESGPADAVEDPLIWRQEFPLGEGALVWVVAGRDLWEAVGRMVLSGQGIDSVADEDCRPVWNDVARQAMSEAATGLRIQAERGEASDDVPDELAHDVTLEIRNSIQIWHVRIAWNSAFAEAFPVPAQSGLPAQVSPDPMPSRTLDLLLDVSLPVSVSFGKTSLRIREVLKLNTGSVVELDRLVSEPVDVIVNNCVIARGEVVVVDGNYGVRVIHIASRADRLRSGMSEASPRLIGGGK